MPPSRIRLIGVAPGAAAMRDVLRGFAKKGGILTSTSDRRLRALRQLLGSEFDVELIPFGEAVGKMCLLAGGKPQPMVQKGHVHAAVAEAFHALPPGSVIEDAGAFPATHRWVAECISELRAWRIGADDLMMASKKADGVQAAKLSDISTIYRDCISTFTALGRDQNAGRLEACLDLDDGSLVKKSRFLVVLGSDYEPLTCDWLLWLASLKAEVVVVVEHHDVLPESFHGAAKAVAHLGVPLTIAGESNRLVRSLLAAPTSGDEIHVAFTNSPDTLAEAEWALRGFLKSAANESLDGCAILARDLEHYAPMVECASRRLGVPLRSSRRVPLLSNGFAKLIVEAIETCAEEDVRSIARLARSTYFESDPGFGEELQIGILAAKQDAAQQWPRLAAWAEGKRDQAPWLALLLDWRDDAISSKHPLTKWIELVRDLGVMPWTWEESARTGSRDDHAQTALQRMLAQVASIENVRSKRVYSLAEFARRLRRLAVDADTSVPENPTGVLLASAVEELGDCHSLTLLGMLEGVFPKRRAENPVFNDDDRRFLSETLKLKSPLPDSHERARAERDELLRVCAAPTQRLTLSYPLVDEERDNIPAFWLKDIEDAAGSVERIAFSRLEVAPTGDYGSAKADQTLAAALNAGVLPCDPPRVTEARSASIVRGDSDRRFEIGELRDAAQCPFRYWARRRAQLATRREGGTWERLSFLPERAHLAHHATPEAATLALQTELSNLVSELQGEADSDDVALLRSGGARLIEGWVEREFKARDLWPKTDIKRKVPLGEGGLKDEIGKTRLRGNVGVVATIGAHTVISRYRLRGSFDDGSYAVGWGRIKPEQQFDIALSLFTIDSKLRGVEVDSASGQRTLIGRNLRSEWRAEPKVGLRVLRLDDEDWKILGDQLRQRLDSARQSIEEGSVEARPSKTTCAFCGYGELCRRHHAYGENSAERIEDEEWPE